MFETIATLYVQAFLTFLPAVALGLLAIGATRSNLPLGRASWALGILAAVFGIWAAAMVPLAQAGILMPPPTIFDPPFAIMPLVFGAMILWALGRFTATGRDILKGLDQRHLIGFQVFRIMGGLFLLGWAFGKVPWQFALPAGLGDIWAGVAAIQALNALNRGAPDARALVVRANVIGLGDFVVAVFTGLITSKGFLHLLSHDAPNIINMYPLALFPAFFVPVFIAFRLFSLAALPSESLEDVSK